MIRLVCFFVLAFFVPALAQPRLVCTLPELSSVVLQLSNGQWNCEALLKRGADPHNAEVTPALLEKLKNAEYLISIGLGLEDSWLKNLLVQSGSKIKWGTENHLEVGPWLQPLASPSGHGHHRYDPHVLLSPKRVLTLYDSLAQRLEGLGCSQCRANSKLKSEELSKKISQWQERLSKMNPRKIASYHGAYDYFFRDFNIDSEMKIEDPKKGIPSGASLLKASEKMKAEKIQRMWLEPSAPSAVGRKLQELMPGLRVYSAPTGLPNEGTSDLTQLFELYVSELEKQ